MGTKATDILLLFVILLQSNSVLSIEQTAEDNNENALRISIIEDNPPFSIVLPNGTTTGLYVDFWKLWSKTNNYPIKFYPSTFERNIQDLMDKTTDIHSGLFISTERKLWADFSVPFHQVSSAFYTYGNEQATFNSKTLKGKRVAVPKGSFLENYLEKYNPDFTLVEFDDTKKAVNELIEGKVSAIFAEIPNMDRSLEVLGLRGIIKKNAEESITNRVHALILKGNPQLLNKINEGIKNMPVEEMILLEQKWLPNKTTYFGVKNFQTDLKKKPLWLQGYSNLVIGIDGNSPPFEFIDDEGDFAGISSSYLNIISQSLDLNLVEKKGYQWGELLNMIQLREIDIIPAVVKTTEREKYLNFSDPYLSFPMVIVSRKDRLFVQDLESLSGKHVGIVLDNFISDLLRKEHFELILEYSPSVHDGLEKLNENKLDAFIANLAIVTHELNHANLNNLRVVATTNYHLDLSIGIRKGLEPLVPFVNSALGEISKKQRAQISNQWLALNLSLGTPLLTYFYWSTPIIALFLVIIFYEVKGKRNLKLEIKNRKSVERSLIKSQLMAESANKSKSEFLANMSHEIRTPMNAVLGFTELLKSSSLDKIQLDYLSSIEVGAKGLMTIINDILDLSKIEAGKLILNYEYTDVVKFMHEIKKIFSKNTERKGIQFDLEFQIQDRLINIDQARVRQILFNLVGNAIKFTEVGRILIKVQFVEDASCLKPESGSPTKGKLILSVLDTGRGIPHEQIDDIFAPFIQQKEQSQQKYGGTGLGLTICRKLANLMKGDIFVESQIGRGSVFSLVLKDVLTMENDKAKENEREILKVNFYPATVLIVDDVKTNRILLTRQLQNLNLNFLEAENGREAVDIAAKFKPELIIMDIRMPILDGIQAASCIRNELKLSDIFIVACTASVTSIDKSMRKFKNFDMFLSKPARRQDVINVLSKLLKTY